MMAASAQAYNAPNVMLMRSDSPSADTLAAMLASCGAQGMQGPRSVGGLEEAVMGGGQNRAFYTMFETSAEETGDDDAADDCAHHVEKKRRLAVDQVRSLEKNFELENKLEPERKMQLARELGLQPRQVAVWFQNRRARWKTKQLERDYDVVKGDNEGLKSENDALKSDLKNVVEKKENLEAEVNNLNAEVLRLKSILQSNLKNFDGQVLETDALDVGADLVPRVQMSPKSESPGRDQDQPQSQPQHQEDYQQLTTVTSETTTAVTVSVHQESPAKSKGGSGGSTSSESNSSEIMNADSPHPIDSVLSPGIDQKTSFGCNQLPITAAGQTTSNVDTTLVQFAEELCGGRLVPPQPFQRIAVNHLVKNEDGVTSSNILQEESSSYFYNMDETGPLSWWDPEWP